MPIADSAGGLRVEQQATLWRRQFECMDSVVHGYIAAEFVRLRGDDPGPAAVTFTDLISARHSLSVPRFYPPANVGLDHFRSSDPASGHYAGRLEAEFAQIRNEVDGRFE